MNRALRAHSDETFPFLLEHTMPNSYDEYKAMNLPVQQSAATRKVRSATKSVRSVMSEADWLAKAAEDDALYAHFADGRLCAQA
jgi:hypothetical protein